MQNKDLDGVYKLLAIEEIKTLKARYFRYLDTKQVVLLKTLFTPDATMLFNDVSSEFMPVAEVYERFTSDHAAECITVHKGFMPEIEIISATEAKGVWAMEDRLIWRTPAADGVTQLRGNGHYHESYALHDGRWKIRKLELTRIRLEVESSPVNLLDYRTFNSKHNPRT